MLTVHCSLHHTLAVTDARSAALRWIGGPLERWGEHRADAVILLTNRLARTLIGGGLPMERVTVIPSGIDPALFTTRPRDPLPHLPRPRILFVGRLAGQKGVARLLDAVRTLWTTAPVVLVGDGPERGDLERRAHRLRIGDRVHFIGFVGHDAVPGYLQHADVMVVPSVYEELGSVLIEAMGAGIPVVGTAVGGIPEAITDGDNGLLVPSGDAAALAAAIDTVVGDPDLAARLATAQRRRAEAYHWPALARRVLDVYRSVAPDDRRPASTLS